LLGGADASNVANRSGQHDVHHERYEQGTVLGLNQSLQSVAQILAPLASTFLIGRRLLAPWAWFPATICLLGLWLCMRMPREAAVQMS
jgi:hypothetical protein